MRLALAFWFAPLLALGQGPLQPGPQPALTSADLQEGERLYLAQCGPCHRASWRGGAEVPLWLFRNCAVHRAMSHSTG